MKTTSLAGICGAFLLTTLSAFGTGPGDNARLFMACLGLPVEPSLTNSIPWVVPDSIPQNGETCEVELSSCSTNRFGSLYRIVVRQSLHDANGTIAACADEATAREYVGFKLGTSSMSAQSVAMEYRVSTNETGIVSIVPAGDSPECPSDSTQALFLCCNLAIQIHGSTNAATTVEALVSAGTEFSMSLLNAGNVPMTQCP
ncbi:MAG: hypothetical protein II840_06005 [Kiritimatiellae bacterium]|nr:hypothetical protein [Kiritimatiellia bacterium]